MDISDTINEKRVTDDQNDAVLLRRSGIMALQNCRICGMLFLPSNDKDRPLLFDGKIIIKKECAQYENNG